MESSSRADAATDAAVVAAAAAQMAVAARHAQRQAAAADRSASFIDELARRARAETDRLHEIAEQLTAIATSVAMVAIDTCSSPAGHARAMTDSSMDELARLLRGRSPDGATEPPHLDCIESQSRKSNTDVDANQQATRTRADDRRPKLAKNFTASLIAEDVYGRSECDVGQLVPRRDDDSPRRERTHDERPQHNSSIECLMRTAEATRCARSWTSINDGLAEDAASDRSTVDVTTYTLQPSYKTEHWLAAHSRKHPGGTEAGTTAPVQEVAGSMFTHYSIQIVTPVLS